MRGVGCGARISGAAGQKIAEKAGKIGVKGAKWGESRLTKRRVFTINKWEAEKGDDEPSQTPPENTNDGGG